MIPVPQLRAPVVLIHGLFGFARVTVFGKTLKSYFHDIPACLEASGNRVLIPGLNPIGSIASRAAQLKAFLDREVPDEPVHLIGHSMGGLDARYLITHLGMAPRVLTLTTVGTPHRGTAFADWGVSRFERLVAPLFDCFCLSRQAFHDLTTAECRRFNEATPDAPGVRYFSVAGRHDGAWYNPEWQLPFQIVSQAEGDNDGVVSVASARYGETFDLWEGDHLSLINWPHPLNQAWGRWRDRKPHYAALLGRLHDAGY